MKIEINIEQQLEDLWRRLGLESDEIESQYRDLNERIEELCKIFLQENLDRFEELQKQAEEVEEDVRQHIKRFGMDCDDEIDETQPILVRIQNARAELESLTEETGEQEDEFNAAFKEITECFDILEMDEEDRGEFATEGEDFSFNKIDRMNALLIELRAEIADREPKMRELADEIHELHEKLALEEFQVPETLGNQTFVELEKYRDELSDKLTHNREEAYQLMKEIRRIENILKCKKTPSDNFDICGDAVVEKLKLRLDTLNKEKENNIPMFIEAYKNHLTELWEELHIPQPSASDFPFIYNSAPNKRTLVALEAEVHRIENLKEHIEPMLDLIATREEILGQYNRLNMSSADSTRLMSRRGVSASSLIEEERIRKRFTNELPKIHAKLIPQLEEYQATFGEPFLWDGEDLLEVVREMHQKEEASMLQSKAKIAKRKSIPKTGSGKKNNLANRAPFQLQEFML